MPVYVVTYRRLAHAWHNGDWTRQITVTADSQEQAEQEAERRRTAHEQLLRVTTSVPEATTAQELKAERRA